MGADRKNGGTRNVGFYAAKWLAGDGRDEWCPGMTDSTKASVRVDTGDVRFAVAYLTGRLDAAGVTAMEPELTRAVATHKQLALDLSGVPYLASMGLRLLLAAAKTLGKRDGRLVVVNPTQDVEAVLAIAGLEKPLRVCTSKNLAAAFGP